MPCLLILAVLFAPRLVLLFLALFTQYIGLSFNGLSGGIVWAVLGFLFMPWTTLAFIGSNINGGGTGWIILIVIAVIFDLGQISTTTANNSSK